MNLHDFCAKDDPRKYLKKPFNLDDKTIATNGHILIAVTRLSEFDNAEAAEKVGDIIKKHMSHKFNDFYKLPKIDFEKFRCEKCDGSGVSDWCYECEGERVVYLGNDHNSYCCNCLSCAAKDNNFCLKCNGQGYGEHFDAIVLHCNGLIRAFSPGYIRLISMLGGASVSLDSEHKEMMFIFDEGFGYLMPIRDAVGAKTKEEFVLDELINPELNSAEARE